MRREKRLVVFLSLSTLLLATTAIASKPSGTGSDPMAQCPAFMTWLKAHHAHAKPATPVKPSDPALRATLLGMLKRDQAARQAVIRAQGTKHQQAPLRKMLAVDAANLRRLAPMLDRHGFPTPARVGRDGVQAAFILVQHADRDPALQARMLPQLAKLRAKGLVSGQDLALLTDRVLHAQGKPQRYGTQFGHDKAHPDVMVPQPMLDPAHVDARRAKLGLPPIKDYACVLSKVYGMPVRVPGPLGRAAARH